MTFGKESNNVPPKPTSQTSCHDHNGPMAAITSRRSASVLPTKYCNMPAPKSKPSSTTNMMSMKVKMAYQISIMGHLQFDGGGNRLRAVGDFAPDQKQIKHAENKIKPGKPHEREQDVAAT